MQSSDPAGPSGTVQALIARCFSKSGPELCIGGVGINSLVKQYGTPLFVYNQGGLASALSSLRETLPRRFEIYYSVKANPNAKILRFFVDQGCGLEIASAGEYLKARAAGCPAPRILFAGPGKTERELALVLEQGIGEIHIESHLEARRTASLGKHLTRPIPVAIRINPSEDLGGGALLMGGKALPFGVDEERLKPLVDYIRTERSLDLQGIHIFSGTQILDVEMLVSIFRKGLELARQIAAMGVKPITTVDFGGGWGIPYFAHESPLDLPLLKTEVERLMSEIAAESLFQNTRFLIEPGRFLTGEAGVYVTQVVDIKQSREKKFIILDGGMHHHLAASGNLGQTIRRNFPIALINKLDRPADDIVDIAGPLCTPLDVLGRAVKLPKAEVGDLVGIFQSGAYALTASPTGFLSHDPPIEIWVENGSACRIDNRTAPT